MKPVTIIPAILTTDRSDLERRLAAVASFASAVHLDVADGQFVTTRTLSLAILQTSITSLTREYHLMVTDPATITNELQLEVTDRLVIHVEALSDPSAISSWSQRFGERLAVSINPSTSLERWSNVVGLLGRVQVMGVEPGRQGAPFVPETIDRVRKLRAAHPDLEITVDGGVSRATITQLSAAGATRFVVGSAIWQTPDPAKAYRALVRAIGKIG